MTLADAKSQIVWVVEQGSYSDYHVVGVFTSRANAKLVADAINGSEGQYRDEATIAEWPLDPAVAELRQGRRPHIVHMLRDGSVERCEPWTVCGYEIQGSVDIWRRSQAPAYRGKGVPDVLTAKVWASDETHAVKITNEHRLRLIAEGRWKA